MTTIKKFNRLGGVPKTTPLKGIKSTEAFPRKTFRLQRRRRIVRPSAVGIKPPYIFDLGGALGAPRSVGLRQQQSLGNKSNCYKNFTTSVATSNPSSQPAITDQQIRM